MSVQLEELLVQLTAEVDKYNANMNAALVATEKATDKMTQAVDSFASQSDKSLSFFDQALATTIGFIGGELVTGAFNKLQEAAQFAFGEILKGVQSAAESETAFTRLANSLALSGQYSRAAMGELQGYADALERTTGISDTATANNLQLLSSLTKLSSTGLMQAHDAAVELSSAIGMDLNAATMLVAKGIATSTDVFKRYGIEIADGGTKAERLSQILAGLSGMTGSAAGAMNNYEGSTKLLGVAYDNLLKAIGKYVTDNPVVIALIQATTTELNNMTGAASGSESALNAFNLVILTFAEAVNMVVQLMEAFVNVGKMLYASLLGLNIALTGTVETLETVFKIMVGLPLAIAGAITGIDSLTTMFREGMAEVDDYNKGFERTLKLMDNLDGLVNSEPYFNGISKAVNNVADSAANMYTVIKAGGGTANPTLTETVGIVNELTEAQRLHMDAIVSFTEGLVAQSNSIRGEYDIQREDLNLSLQNKLLDYETFWALRSEQIITQAAEEQAMLQAARDANKITETQYSQAILQLKKNQVLEEKKLSDERALNEKKNRELILNQTANLFGALSMLSESSNKELVLIGKAAAIAQATINTYVGMSRALADLPYPASVIAATAVGIQGALTVAKISGVGFKNGIDRVPGMGAGDRVPAMLEPGERVTPKRTNRDLTRFLAEQEKRENTGQITVQMDFTGATFLGNMNQGEIGAMLYQAIEEAKAKGMVTA